MAKLLLYTLIFYVTVAASTEAVIDFMQGVRKQLSKETTRDAKSIYDQVFTGTGLLGKSKEATLLPTEVRQKLLELSELYGSSLDRTSMKTKYEIDQLIDVQNIRRDKCSPEYFAYLDRLLKQYGKTPNILLYLQAIRARQFNTCDDFFRNQLQNSLSNLGSQKMFDMIDIHLSVKKSGFPLEKPYSYIPKEAIVKSLAITLDKLVRSSANRQIQYSSVFDHENNWNYIVYDLCKDVEIEARDPLRFYEYFLNDDEDMEKMDSWIIEWLTNIRICRDVSRGGSDLREKVFKLFKELREKNQ